MDDTKDRKFYAIMSGAWLALTLGALAALLWTTMN